MSRAPKHKHFEIKPIKSKRFIALAIFLVIILIITGKRLSSSLFFHHNERLNLVFYGPSTTFFSMDLDDNVNYYVSLFPDLKVPVPGGYGYYRIGALGKLISLEKRPELLPRSISLVTTTFVDYYFYPPAEQVYYGEQGSENKVRVPGFKDIFLTSTNASFFDKMYIWLMFANNRQGNITELTEMSERKKQGDVLFSQDDFIRMYQGYFYQNTFRSEKKNVQILYNKKYTTADSISSILQGSGVRVSDISETDNKVSKCTVYENVSVFSKTAQNIAKYFKCNLKKADTDIYDILLLLGNLEKDWEVTKGV